MVPKPRVMTPKPNIIAPKPREIVPNQNINNTDIDDFKRQLLKLNTYKTQTLKKYKNTYTNTNTNTNTLFTKVTQKNTNTNAESSNNIATKKHNRNLYVNTTHKIPDDPIFKEPLKIIILNQN